MRCLIQKRRGKVSMVQMRAAMIRVPLIFMLALSGSRCPSFASEPAPPSAASETPPQSALDEYIRREMDSQHIPGLSLAVVRDGKLVLAKGYGKASVELDAPATSATLYALASLSKPFTATAIMLLVEDGKIRLDDSL